MIPVSLPRMLFACATLIASLTIMFWFAHLCAGDNRQLESVLGTLFTAGVIFSYAWISPQVFRFVARGTLPQTSEPAARRRMRVMTARLSRRGAIPAPEIVLLQSDRICAAGFGMPGRSVIFMTSGLYSVANSEVLRGVIAHEISHVARRHALFQSIVFSGLFCGKFLIGIPGIFGPFIFLGYLAILRQCEYDADKGMASLIGDAAALRTLHGLASILNEKTRNGLLTTILSTHPCFCRRIDRLAPRISHI